MWSRKSLVPIRLRRSRGRPRAYQVPPRIEPLEDRTAPAVLFQPSPYHASDYLGPVIQQVHVDLILWGDAWANSLNLAARLQVAVDSIASGPYLTDLAQYRNIGPGFLQRTDFIPDPRLPGRFGVADVVNVLQVAIVNGLVPDPRTDPQRLYLVVPPPGSHFVIGGGLGEAGGYHSFAVNPLDGVTRYYYGLEANPRGDLDFLTSLYSHELVEAVSDPEAADPARRGFQLDPGGGDKELCDGDAEKYSYRIDNFQYRVEPYWSNRAGAYIVPTGDVQDITVGYVVSRGVVYSNILTVKGDQKADLNDQITVDLTAHGGVNVTLNNEVFQFNRREIRGIIVLPGRGTNTVTIAKTNVPVHVNFTQGAGDTWNIGAPGNGRLDNIRAPIWGVGNPGDVDVVLNDQGNMNAGDTYTLDRQRFSRTRLAGYFHYKDVHSLTLNTGPQNKTVVIKATEPNTPTTVNLNAGNVTLAVGDPSRRHVNGLRGPLTVHSQAAVVDATVYDQRTSLNGQVYTLTATRLTRTGGFTFNFDTLRTLTVNTGSGNDTVNVQATSAATTNVNAGQGVNTVTVAGTAAGTTTNVGLPRGTLNLGNPGNGTLDSLAGRVNFTLPTNQVNLVFNEQGNPNNDVYTLTNGSLTRVRNNIGFIFNAVLSLTLNLGTGNNTVQVPSAQPGTTIRGGGGNNTVKIQGLISTAQVTLVNIQMVQVDGGGTFNVVNDLTVRDVIVNNGSLNVQNGTLAATGMFTQPGGTTTVSLGADLSVAGGATIQGGTLTGLGTVTGNVTNAGQVSGWLTIAGNLTNNGLVSPGDGGDLGGLTVGGNYMQTAAGALAIKVAGGNADQLRVGAVVMLNGGLLVNPIAPPTADSYDILMNLGPNAINGIFAGLPEGAPVMVAGQTYNITYMGGTGHDVVLHMAMTEPTVFVYNVPGFVPVLVPPVACGIISGAVTNWNQVGGPNLPVTFVYRLDPDNTTADMNAFTTMFCGFPVPPFPVGVARVGGQAVADMVAATPGAIGYVSQGIAQGHGLPFQPVPRITEPPDAADHARGKSLAPDASFTLGAEGFSGNAQGGSVVTRQTTFAGGDYGLDQFFETARTDDTSPSLPRAPGNSVSEGIDWALNMVGQDGALLS